MKTKNIIKKIFVGFLLIIITGLFVSCEYKKNTEENNGFQKSSEKKSKNIDVNEKLTAKEIKSGRFQTIKKDEKIIPIKEVEVTTKDLKGVNISPQGGGSIKGGTKTGANPLSL